MLAGIEIAAQNGRRLVGHIIEVTHTVRPHVSLQVLPIEVALPAVQALKVAGTRVFGGHVTFKVGGAGEDLATMSAREAVQALGMVEQVGLELGFTEELPLAHWVSARQHG